MLIGGKENIRVRRLEECGTCSGSGAKPGAKIKSCSVCNGQGVVNNMQRTPFGIKSTILVVIVYVYAPKTEFKTSFFSATGVFNNVQTCPNCRGVGQEVEEYCPSCKGKGSLSETKEVQIKIPSGIESGATLRVRDAGNAGKRGGPRGDLFVQLAVKRDPKFKREGTEIYTDEEISYTEAILGTTIKADTVDGKTEVRIPFQR